MDLEWWGAVGRHNKADGVLRPESPNIARASMYSWMTAICFYSVILLLNLKCHRMVTIAQIKQAVMKINPTGFIMHGWRSCFFLFTLKKSWRKYLIGYLYSLMAEVSFKFPKKAQHKLL